MKKLKGPDLKVPDLKVPAFLSDLYLDLRDRRLLPLVAFVLVAIVAVPFLLSGGSEEPDPPRVAPAPAGAPSVNASQLTVVPATPGLRDYRKRLQGRSAKDPFKGPETAQEPVGGELGSKGDNGFESSEVTSTSTTTSATDTTTETTKTTKSKDGVVTETTTESTDEPGSTGTPGELTLFTLAIDVRITKTTTAADGSPDRGDPLTRSRVLSPSPLPGEKAQVVTFMGISSKTRNPYFLVSDEVTSIFGEAKCLSGDQRCQLLEAEKGMPLTFVYGPGGDRYKITVLKVYPVTAGEYR